MAMAIRLSSKRPIDQSTHWPHPASPSLGLVDPPSASSGRPRKRAYEAGDVLYAALLLYWKNDATQIRKELVQDLQRAQDLLPDSYGNADRGRASRLAAATLMVKIYLILEACQEARDKAVEIIWSIVFIKDLNPMITTDLFTPRLRDEPKNSDEKEALLEARNEGFTVFGLAIPKCGFVDEFPQDDLRRPSNIVESYLSFELNYPYMPKMWNLDQINSPRQNHGENYIVFRLADVYLMAAEVENELNGPVAAYQYINAVRARAYDSEQPLSGLSQQQFREALYDERKWELAGEGHRRMDLIR